jgi:peroxiredoxin-like protein
MNSEHYYQVEVSWQTDRKGILTSTELETAIEVVTPPQFPKGIEKIWSPEHLFVAAVNSCLMTTFLSIAENSKLEFENFTSKAIGKLEIIDGKYVISEITLMPIVTTNNENKQKAERVLQKSEANCLISNSIKSKIIFKPIVQITINS